jgi:outer membrane murein-binding lipoprotein Lpp
MKKIRNNALVGVSICAVALLSGCGDSAKVAELQARIDALEQKQKEDGAKLAAMSQKIVTRTIEVEGSIKVGKNDGFGFVTVYPWGIELNRLNDNDKVGHVSRLEAHSLRISDFDGRYNQIAGNGVQLSIKGTLGTRGLVRQEENENGVKLWSARSEGKGGVYRNLWNESAVKTEASFAMNEVGDVGVRYVNEKGGGSGRFGVRIGSISDGQIVRLQMANLLALSVIKVVGVLEVTSNLGKNEQSKFVVDRKMDTGVWEAVAVAISIDRDQIAYLTVKDIDVGAAFFK